MQIDIHIIYYTKNSTLFLFKNYILILSFKRYDFYLNYKSILKSSTFLNQNYNLKYILKILLLQLQSSKKFYKFILFYNGISRIKFSLPITKKQCDSLGRTFRLTSLQEVSIAIFLRYCKFSLGATLAKTETKLLTLL